MTYVVHWVPMFWYLFNSSTFFPKYKPKFELLLLSLTFSCITYKMSGELSLFIVISSPSTLMIIFFCTILRLWCIFWNYLVLLLYYWLFSYGSCISIYFCIFSSSLLYSILVYTYISFLVSYLYSYILISLSFISYLINYYSEI